MFDGLNIGLSALKTQKTSLNVAGHNIANANNEDYTRQDAIQTAKQPYNLPGANFQIGSGVKIEDVKRVQNEFINQQIREESQTSGYWERVQQGLERIENVFNEPSDSSLKSAFNSFWNSIQDLNTNPNDTATRATVKNQGMLLTDTFRSINDQLSDYKRALNDDYSKTVSEINSIVDRISGYNERISTAVSSNNTPNDLLDKRDALYNDLNKLIDVKSTTDKLGNLNITLDGKSLVRKFETNTLKTVDNGVYEDELALDINGEEVKVNVRDGELKGIQDVRDVEINNYLDVLDDMASSIVDKFNEIHSNGFDLDGDIGNNFFKLNSTYDRASRGIEVDSSIKRDGGIRNIAAGSFSENPKIVSAEISDSSNIDTSKYYDVKITEGTTNDFNYEVSNNGTVLDSGSLDKGDKINLTAAEGFELTVNNTGVTSVNFNKSSGNGNNAAVLGDVIKEDKILNDASITDNYEALISTIGVNAQKANQMQKSQESLVNQLSNIRESVSGVSLDEEMAELVKFQQAYNAAAKFITKTDELMDSLMAMIR